jgi:hypothetical protein
MTEIITFIITVAAMTIGYLIGSRERINAPEIAHKIKQKIIQSQIKAGPLMRPTVKQIDKRENKKLYEGVEETKKAFDALGVKENA